MRQVIVFNQVTLDGYFSDAKGDMSWAHKSDPEWDAYTADNAKHGGLLLFGRKTFDLMASYWPTDAARRNAPVIAERMNHLPKIVFSRTLGVAAWQNTLLVKDDLPGAVRKLKTEAGPDMVIMGSGSIVAQLAAAHLIDEFQLVFNPLVLGAGKTLFEGIRDKLEFKLLSTRPFANGNVVLTYAAGR